MPLGNAHVVLEHEEGPVDAHHVDPRDVTPGGARRADAHDVAQIAGTAVHEPPRHNPVADRPLRAVAVGDEEVERHGALRQCFAERPPLACREDARYRVEGKDRRDALGGNPEGDASVGKPLLRVPSDPRQGARSLLECREQLGIRGPDSPVCARCIHRRRAAVRGRRRVRCRPRLSSTDSTPSVRRIVIGRGAQGSAPALVHPDGFTRVESAVQSGS